MTQAESSTRGRALGALCLLLTVALGAFGAHGLGDLFAVQPLRKDTWETAVLYQAIHGLALLWCSGREDPWIQRASLCFAGGVVVFSGSLYLLVLTNTPWLGAITPLGGISFLVGWVLVLWSTRQSGH